MSAETLRKAASAIRADYSGRADAEFENAVADWLEHVAEAAERDALDGWQMGPEYPGLVVARAYLGESA